jgi:hypothetical protein
MEKNLNEKLFNAVSRFDIKETSELLSLGADINAVSLISEPEIDFCI